MSRHKQGRAWVDDGPRGVDEGAVAWPMKGYGSTSAYGRAWGRDMDERPYYGLGNDSLATHSGRPTREEHR